FSIMIISSLCVFSDSQFESTTRPKDNELWKSVNILARQLKKKMRAFEQFPGPPGNWLFGHLRQDGTDFSIITKWGEQYPYAFPLQFGPTSIYLTIHHSSYLKTVLASAGANVLDHLSVGEGLLVSAGQKWFRHRRLLTPGFHYDILKPYVKLMADSANIMLDKWETYAKTEQSFELFQQVSLMTLDSIMKCAFSYNSNCQTERWEEVIRKRKEALSKEKEQDILLKRRNLDFLDILLCTQQQQGLSDEAIRAEVDTFMFEGHDTTASGISWILYNMACYPEHQQKCREEIQEALKGKDSMEWEDLSKIPYTTMCIKESLRLYLPVPGLARKLTKPMTFFDGRTIPEGRAVHISVSI
uniref:Cytochrome P450, family 4, subfamily T, polypeptide 8 n=1 Tax=Electrophorus electricus TaxID=8005 RepID=A0AAY5F5U0_ELEEL